MRHYQVITVGEATIDAFMTLQKMNPQARIDSETGDICFRHGEKIDVDRYDFCIGGNATNVAVGLRRLGIKATLCSEIGDDEFSLKIRNMLAAEDIDRLFITQTKDTPSNFSMIINFKGDRTIFVKNIEREHDFHLMDAQIDLIYLTSLAREWKRPYHYFLTYAKEHNVRLAFNPGSLQLYDGREVVQKVLERTDILFVNKEEAQKILYGQEKFMTTHDHEYIKELLHKLKETGPKIIVLTDGKHGSFAIDEEGNFHFHGVCPGQTIERTGAGDSFTSSFLAATLHGLPVTKAMLWGSLNAASVIGRIGAQAGLLTKDQIEARAKVY